MKVSPEQFGFLRTLLRRKTGVVIDDSKQYLVIARLMPIVKKRAILSPEAFAKQRREFEQRVIGVQKLVQKRKRQLDQAQVDAMFKVEGQLNKIITQCKCFISEY